ncbi:NADPH-dependent 1-acyl dihydroxyacetone phosphate reductase [Coemansia interrupta]|uniref:NADPH-dependent 1-acyl dihydroxyacetone phosphate reductase n=1 Tax=Coemansia interrupta TaxID=1126814 RepID=A0A9W8LJS3_9FUNG|nr:NADPH-dependent 1-acyl dihydroxyacetone phosphate reductase [Coemansia interrupta]
MTSDIYSGRVPNFKRVVLITGCSSGGIGHHLALEFAQRGCKVYASARNVEKLDIPSLKRHNIETVELDVTNGDSVDAAVEKVIKEAGCIDVLVNNAGQICIGPAVEVPISRVQQIFEVNVTAVARMCQAVAPHMMDRRKGTIVNIGSVSGYLTTPWVGYYAATKAAVHAMSDALRLELEPFNVSVTVVAPGSVKSHLVDAQRGEQLLADDSRYLIAIDAVRARAELSQKENPTPTEKFARVVVPQLLVARPKAYITYGGNSTSAFLAYFVPPFIRDIYLKSRFGINKMKSEMESSQSVEGVCPVSQRRGGQCPVGMGAAQNAGSGSLIASLMTRCPVTNPAVWAVTAVVLITGCSAGGIGHALALEFASHGCLVYASARDKSKLDASLSACNIEGIELDVTDEDSVQSAVSKIVAHTGRIDILVNNAGQGCVGPAVEVDCDRVHQVMDVNFIGPTRMCRAVAPYMMDRRQGTIVNVGSVGGYAATPWVGYYAASKAALHALSDSMRVELVPFNVRVVVVAPGSIKSNLISAQASQDLISPGSRYAKALGAIRAKSEYGRELPQTSAAEFARTVVSRVLGRSPPAYISCGKYARLTWLMYFVPPAIRDPVFGRKFGVAGLKRDLDHL